MSGQVRRSLVLALAGLIGGLALALALFGGESLRSLTGRPAAEPPAEAAPEGGARSLADPGTLARRTDPPIDFRDDAPGPAGAGSPAAGPQSGPPREAGSAGSGPAGAAAAPRFDIVRVEPNGDTVVAGRGAPHAVVEMLVDGKPVAKATADASGQFAIVPPALPAGPSEIRLRMTGRDGRASGSEQSVAVQVAPGRDRQPLVALTAPDAATVVLSQPGAPGPGARVADAAPAGGPASAGPGAGPATRIVSVDVQGNGRLFVTATGAPGATLRLYLNDTLIAPGRIGPDGRASFTIGRGVKPGQYQVRIDRIDPGTGKVDTRAEVPLTVPEPSQVAARDPAGPPPAGARGAARTDGQGGGKGDGRGDGKGDGKGRAQGTAQATGKAGPDRTGSAAPAAAGPALPEARNLAAETGGEAASGAVYVPEISTAKITRGDNLWRISQRTYGRGERYTVIYDANQTQIRDPDLIYPGQIFVLPTDKRG